ncbi:MAG TPA: aminopeptidase [Anaerolineales bacterium]|nr:aminopeptidase [Anaerolineales bacterium]
MIPRKTTKSARSQIRRSPSRDGWRGTGVARAPLAQTLKKYIDVILDVGLNLQPGQRLLIVNNLIQGVDVNLAAFVRLLAEAAYRRGSPYVDVIWGDPLLERLRLQKASRESLKEYPKWPSDARMEHVEPADAYLALRADDPDLLAGIDPNRIGDYLAAIRDRGRALIPIMSRNHANWCVATVSSPEWAAKVLPKAPEGKRVEALWNLIFETCRIYEKKPVDAWRMHISGLAKRKDYLNAKRYTALQYRAPGTRLKVGLPAGHLWFGGQMKAENGVDFVPNLPTEEVFTLAHLSEVQGEVTATKPLIYNGNTIDGMRLTFEAGKVAKASARKGEAILRQLLEADAGSSRLGEVALVPHSSPVSRLGVTFQSTLFDENASCHLALGQAYRFTLQGAERLSDEAFAEVGGNSSKVHSDFMMGSDKMDIDGIRADGRAEPVFRSGEWALEL